MVARVSNRRDNITGWEYQEIEIPDEHVVALIKRAVREVLAEVAAPSKRRASAE